MNAKRIAKTAAGYLGRLPLCAAAYVGGAMGSAALALALLLVRPGEARADEQFARSLLCAEPAAIEK